MELQADEVIQMMQQLYPDQTARVLAELKAMKLQQRVQELEANATEE